MCPLLARNRQNPQAQDNFKPSFPSKGSTLFSSPDSHPSGVEPLVTLPLCPCHSPSQSLSIPAPFLLSLRGCHSQQILVPCSSDVWALSTAPS